LEIERAATESGETPHEWCRITTLEAARMPTGLTPNQRVLFAQMTRAGFLVENGFNCSPRTIWTQKSEKDTAFMPEQTLLPSPTEPWPIFDRGAETSYELKKVAEREWPRKSYARCPTHNVFLQWEGETLPTI